MEQLRVGVVGCGEVTQIIHLPCLQQLSEKFVVTALCDISRNTLNTLANQWGVTNTFLDYRELVEHGEVDVVLIANPHAYHAEVALAAIGAGKHVLVEKPMCITLREADAIIEAQRKHGVTVQVGYMRRYAPAFTHACNLVKELASIHLARVHDVIGQNALIIERTSKVLRGSDVPRNLLDEGKALQNALVFEAIGEAPQALQNAYQLLLGLSSHDISAMREILGMPKRVLYAATRHDGRYISAAFDYGSYVCQFETGVDNIPRFDGHIEIYGSEKVIKVQYDTPYVLNLPIRAVVTEANVNGGVVEQSIHPTWGDPFIIEWKSFYNNVTQQISPKTDPADFRRDLEIFDEMVSLMREPNPALDTQTREIYL